MLFSALSFAWPVEDLWNGLWKANAALLAALHLDHSGSVGT